MEKHILYKILLILFLSSVFYACSPTRYVGKDDYLLNRVKMKIDEKNVSTADLKKVIRQRPNTRILGVIRFHLGLYNLSGNNEKKRFNRWLRSIGEAPVVYSPFMTDRSKKQLELYLNNKGYYKASVSDSVWFKKKKAYVEYRIQSGPVTRIQDFNYQADSGVIVNELPYSSPVFRMMVADSAHTLIRREMPMDVDVLEKERERVTEALRANGYYNFSKDYLQYYADTLKNGSPEKADLIMTIINNPAR